jgi:hypothetical protein
LNVFFIQLIFIIQERFASYLITGSVNALALGWLFMQVPETIIGTAIGVALLPTLSEQIARQELEAFGRSLNHALRVILALSIPAAALMAITLRPVVGLLHFDEIGTNLVTWTARAFLLGLMGQAVLEVAVRGFYAQQDARTPLYAAMLTALLFGAWLFPVPIQRRARDRAGKHSGFHGGGSPASLSTQAAGSRIIESGQNGDSQLVRKPGWQSGGIWRDGCAGRVADLGSHCYSCRGLSCCHLSGLRSSC